MGWLTADESTTSVPPCFDDLPVPGGFALPVDVATCNGDQHKHTGTGVMYPHLLDRGYRTPTFRESEKFVSSPFNGKDLRRLNYIKTVGGPEHRWEHSQSSLRPPNWMRREFSSPFSSLLVSGPKGTSFSF